ncbi:hypothetical protein GCM10020254_73710 [Streptomyces goshikiensis]
MVVPMRLAATILRIPVGDGAAVAGEDMCTTSGVCRDVWRGHTIEARSSAAYVAGHHIQAPPCVRDRHIADMDARKAAGTPHRHLPESRG